MARPTQAPTETAVESAVIETLSALLANSYTLYVKTHGYHWNVTGPMFSSLHAMFEVQYTEFATAVDEIAERMRALDAYAPGSFAAFAAMSTVSEDTGHPSAEQMISNLADDNETVADAARRTPKRPATPRRRTWRPSASRSTRKTPGCCGAISVINAHVAAKLAESSAQRIKYRRTVR